MSAITTIQSTDLISNSRTDINNNFSALNTDKIETSVIDTDSDLGGVSTSNAKLPSQKAVRDFVVATASPVGKSWNEYAEANSGTDSYTVSVPGVTSYVTGQTFKFKADVANTGACTLNVNGLGAKTIKKNVTTDLVTNDILANQIFTVIYDGTNMQMVNFMTSSIPASLPITSSSGQTTHNISSTTTTTIAHGLGVIPSYVNIFALHSTNNDRNGTNSVFLSKANCIIAGGITNYDSTYHKSVSGTSPNGSSAVNITGFSIFRYFEGNTDVRLNGVVTVDSTNLTITWSKTEITGSLPSENCNITWTAIK